MWIKKHPEINRAISFLIGAGVFEFLYRLSGFSIFAWLVGIMAIVGLIFIGKRIWSL